MRLISTVPTHLLHCVCPNGSATAVNLNNLCFNIELEYQAFYLNYHFQSKGDEVVKSLQYLCSNDVDVPIGSIIHTGIQNERGGYENDCSLIRLAPNQ